MGKIEYNAFNFANAIVYANKLHNNAKSTKSQIEGILSEISPPEGLDINNELAQIREQINSFYKRTQEIVADLEYIKTEIETMDANASAQIENYISIAELYPKDKQATIISGDDLPWYTKLKSWFKNTGAASIDTVRTGGIAVAEGIMNTVVVPTMKGINWTIAGFSSKLGIVDDNLAYKKIEENIATLNWLSENPYTEKYTDANGIEHYKSYMIDNSKISSDGKIYTGFKTVSGMVGNAIILATPFGWGIMALEAGGNSGDKALSQGYKVNGDTINYVLLREGIEAPLAKLEQIILGIIPQSKGVKGAFENIVLSGLSQAPNVFIDSTLQYATYNTKRVTTPNGKYYFVRKPFSEIWNENGGWKQTGADIATGMVFGAGGEALSGFAHYKTNKSQTKQFENLFEEINQKYGNGVSWYKDDIMKDLDATLKTSGKTITDKKNAVKYMEDYIKADDGQRYFSYQDKKDTILSFDNNGEYIPEPFYNFPEIHDKMGTLDANSVKINNYTSKYNANKVDLNNNSLIMSNDAFSQMQHIKDTGAAAFNLSVGNGKSINVFQTSSPDHHIIHEGIHDSANKVSGTSGFMYWEGSRGINEGATEFIASDISGLKNQSGYEPIVEVYRAIEEGLDVRGVNGKDAITKNYYAGDEISLEFDFQTVIGEPHNTLNSDTYTKFKDAAQVIATKERYRALDVHKAQQTLKDITNKILDATADYKLQGGK